MATIYDLKPRFQSLLRPAMPRLAALGVTPNAITLLALIGSVAVGAALPCATSWRPLLLLLPIWLFVRMALNAIDGMMARELRMATALGGALNEIGDVVSDLVLYLPLASFHGPANWFVIGFAIGAALTEFCGVLGKGLGASRHYDGPMGKSDRACVVGVLGLVTYFYPNAVRLWPSIFAIAALLTVITCWKRIARALAELRASADQPARRMN
jgi:CDP-diacylglycerol--glycerol-3-phosphate 3-phosphatidyltransferase